MQEHKSLEIKAPVLQKDTDRPPEPCWLGPLSLPGVCFCRTEGRVDNRHVLGYCTNIIWKLREKCSYPVQFEGLDIGFFFFVFFLFLITVVGMPRKFRPSFPTFPVEWAPVCKSVFTSDSTLQRGIASVFFTLT